MFKICLFDLDGTLTDSKEGIIKSFQYTLKHFGIKEPDCGYEHFIGPALRDIFKTHCGFDDAMAETATAKYRERYATVGMYENKLYPGVAETLAALKDNGATVALATSKTAVYADKILKHFDIYDYFSFTAGSNFDGTRSDKKELIEYALDGLNVGEERKKTAVMAGDREYDITGAKRAGIKSIGVTYGYGSREELVSAGADYLAASPRELLEIILN